MLQVSPVDQRNFPLWITVTILRDDDFYLLVRGGSNRQYFDTENILLMCDQFTVVMCYNCFLGELMRKNFGEFNANRRW